MDVTRRSFLTSGALAAAAYANKVEAQAAAPTLKVGLVGCGGRASGWLGNRSRRKHQRRLRRFRSDARDCTEICGQRHDQSGQCYPLRVHAI